jgi:hypothetical protein
LTSKGWKGEEVDRLEQMQVLEKVVGPERFLDELAELRIALIEPSSRRDPVGDVCELGFALGLVEEFDKIWEELRLDWEDNGRDMRSASCDK